MNKPAVIQDEGAERALLGTILLSPGALDGALGSGLAVTHFYDPKHRTIFAAMVRIRESEQPVDLVTLAGRLEAEGALLRVGGYSYLAALPNSAPSVANSGAYASRIKDRAGVREVVQALEDLRERALAPGAPISEILDEVEGRVTSLRESGAKGIRSSSELAIQAYEDLRYRAGAPGGVTGLSTGFADLDRMLCGMQPTDLLILAARPSMGKTAFALNVVAHAVLKKRVPVAFFSLEMGRLQLLQRMMCSEARVSGDRMRSGRLRKDDWPAIFDASEKLAAAPLYVDDLSGQSIAQVRSKCRQVVDLGLVVVDYLQLMRGTQSKNGNREQEIASISRGLKGLAKELNIPVLALAQINRGVESRVDKRPLMGDLRESGAIEQDADVIMFLYRDEVYNPEPENQGLAELLIRKHRNGSTGDVKLGWRKEFTRFDNLVFNSTGPTAGDVRQWQD
tara:strand:+ start:2078 stop:3433 length:1356 start_codon:yes stop_codon:yes gene_type:complete